MTVFTNSSIFQPVAKNVKFQGGDLKVISGVSTLSELPLCNVKVPFIQYQRLSVQIPKGQIDYVVSFPMLGLKTTFITIKASYCSVNPSLNFLKWKFEPSSDAKWSFTNILVLTATTDNPIPPILIDNLNPDCNVTLDILVTAMDNDYLDDSAAFIYLKNLEFTNVHTYNETTSQILAFFNEDNNLVTTVNISDIINVQRIIGKYRLVIDESSDSNIVLDFKTEYDTLQALSAINWVMLDPTTRFLPQIADTTPPVINYKNTVISGSITINLSLYPTVFTKQDFITAAILSVVDNRDGIIIPTVTNITFKDSLNVELVTIIAPGNYTAIISVYDLAGNNTTQTVAINMQGVIVDNTPPVFTFDSNVTANVVNPININTYSGLFTYNDAKVLTILSVIDAVSGPISLSAVSTIFKDIYGVTVPNITTSGTYTIEFSAADASTNTATEILTMYANNPSVNNVPEIKFNTNNVVLPALTASISLAAFTGTFTKTNAISQFVMFVTDDIDGTIILNPSNVTILNNLAVPQASITSIGTYTVTFTVTDSGSLTTVKTITLTVNV